MCRVDAMTEILKAESQRLKTKGCEMESNVILEFGEHELATGIKMRRLSKPRYALRRNVAAPARNALRPVLHKQPGLTGILRWVDGGTVAATTFLTVGLARGHLSHEQAATFAAAGLVAVLTFFLFSHIRDHQFSNSQG
jgi:hypothetical protein